MMMQHLYNWMLVHYTVNPKEPQNGQTWGLDTHKVGTK